MRIDPHVHLRDGPEQEHKETLKHGFHVAWDAGLSGVFEMPNTDPPLTNRRAVENRVRKADAALRELGISLFHGIVAGVTGYEKQIIDIVELWREFFPRICGLKMYAGHSTGNMGVLGEKEQALVYRVLAEQGFTGVLMVHCEKEELLRPDLFDPEIPVSHCRCRPPEAEVASVLDQIRFAEKTGFRGNLHICHVSVPETIRAVEQHRREKKFSISCGITPHHVLLSEKNIENMKGPSGHRLKMNPPLRSEQTRKETAELLLSGKIDWVESDHAPHTLEEKEAEFYSGIPVLHFYADFLNILKAMGASEELLEEITGGNVLRVFGLDAGLFPVNPGAYADHRGDYGFDPFSVFG